MTDMYIDTDNPLIESLANWSMIPNSLWERIQELKCLFLWKKIDIVTPNDPECAELFKQSMSLIEDLNIYDLFRT